MIIMLINYIISMILLQLCIINITLLREKLGDSKF